IGRAQWWGKGWMPGGARPMKKMRNFQQQVEQVPHLSQMARDTLERLSQPHAHNTPPPEGKGSRHDWLGRLVGAVLLVGAAEVGLGQQLEAWPAWVMLAG
ncbi:ubiquinone biosynthesis protein UbiB, partial [Vibrio vulnificus]